MESFRQEDKKRRNENKINGESENHIALKEKKMDLTFG